MPLPSRLPDDFIKKSTNNANLIGNRYSIVKRIGAGNFGTAFLIEDGDADNDNEKRKVLKQISVGPVDPGETVDAMQEARLLSQLHHKNIVQFHQSFMDGHFFCIVLEYCEGGDLEGKIKACKKNNETVPEEQVIRWLKQLLRAITYLHVKRILHRDLKSRNIFLKDNQIKIGDFGISKLLIGTTDKASTFVGTPYYMSPEVLNHEEYDEKCDIWSLGCVLYEICCFEHAFNGTSLMDVMMRIVSKHTPQLPELYSRGLNNILQSMLHRDVNVRQTAKQILAHPLFKKVDTLPRNSKIFMTARQRLIMRKQLEADAKAKRLREMTRLKYAETERIRKESQERNFSRSSFDVNMVVQDLEHMKPSASLSAIPDDELQGTVLYKPLESTLVAAVQAESTLKPDPGEENTLTDDKLLGSTDELIQSLIDEGHIPEDGDLADTFYSLQDDFEPLSNEDLEEESSSDDLPDDRVEMSDSEYRDMLGVMQDALYLDSSVLTRKSDVSSRSSDDEQSPRKFEKLSKPFLRQTLPAFPQNRPLEEQRPLTAAPPPPPPDRPLSNFAESLMEQRITNFRQRCIDALGSHLFNEAYQIASSFSFDDLSKNDDKLRELNNLVPDKNRCMDLEQLIYLEKQREQAM